jgi:replicative DNA helicase
MAKSKAKGRTKLPKTIAGVKVPKALRKSGGLDLLLADPQTREILADVLIAAAGAAAAALVKERPAMRQVAETGEAALAAGAEAGSAARDLVQEAASAAASVITDAAKAMLPSSLTGSGEPATSRKPPGVTIKRSEKRHDGE